MENAGIKDTLQLFQALKVDLRTKDQRRFKNYNRWMEHWSRFPDSEYAKDSHLLRVFFPYYDEV